MGQKTTGQNEMLRLRVPAKLNLALDVLSLRPTVTTKFRQ